MSGTSIAKSYSSGQAKLTLSGTDTVANYLQVLRTIVYNNIAPDPDPTLRIITFEADDGTDTSNVATANVFVHNEPDNSVYIEASYPFSVQDVDLGVSMGIVPQKSDFYATNNFGVTVLGLSATKEIPITESFGLPVSVMYIVNPTPGVERSFLVFGISL